MKIHIKNIAALCLLSATMLTSCESRKDPFHSFNSVPQVYVNDKARNFDDHQSTVSILLRHGEESVIYFDYTDDYTETGISIDYALFSEGQQLNYITTTLDLESRKLVIKDTLKQHTLNDKVYKFAVKIYVTDYYGDRGEAVVNVVDCDNLAPVPVITIQKIQGMEYQISAASTKDSDGDDIVAYEYLIDGETTINQAGYEDPGTPNHLINPGMAAQKGTYIISTKLSSVKHAFQSAGTHIIQVRAKDSLGLWSRWYSLNLDVE